MEKERRTERFGTKFTKSELKALKMSALIKNMNVNDYIIYLMEKEKGD